MPPRKTTAPRTRHGRYVALLRGINVGGKNKLPMTSLARVFEEAGCGAVTTYIQSGNVVFEAPPTLVERLPAELARRIERGFGLRVPVVLRAAHELARVTRDNPFLGRDADDEALHVMFLADMPSASAVSGLDANRSPPDELAVVGREIYLRCPQGIGRSKLTNAYFDTKLGTTSTCRNWRTVLRLIELANA